MTEKKEKIKAHCPNCGEGINADVVSEYRYRWDDDGDYGMWAVEDHRILRCCGCDAIYHQTVKVFSEDYDMRSDPVTGNSVMAYNEDVSYWPSPIKRDRPEWLDELISPNKSLYDILQEVYTAFDNDLKVLAATGMRTAFDASTEILGIDATKTFAEKLSDLLSSGKIGGGERSILDTLTNAGSAAAHRGWKPTVKQLGTMMDIIEQFLYRNFVLDGAAKELQEKIPPKKKKK